MLVSVSVFTPKSPISSLAQTPSEIIVWLSFSTPNIDPTASVIANSVPSSATSCFVFSQVASHNSPLTLAKGRGWSVSTQTFKVSKSLRNPCVVLEVSFISKQLVDSEKHSNVRVLVIVSTSGIAPSPPRIRNTDKNKYIITTKA